MKHTMRKSLALVLALVMLLAALPMLAVAEDDAGAQDGAPVESPAAEPKANEPEEPTAGEIAYAEGHADLIQCGGIPTLPEVQTGFSTQGVDTIYTTIAAGMKNNVETIDISSYGVTGTYTIKGEDTYGEPIYEVDCPALMQIFENVINDRPELFNVSMRYGFGFRADANNVATILSISPEYSMEAEAYAAALQTYDAELTKICAGVQSTWTNLEKALYLHDYIALNFEYDLRLYDDTQVDNTVYDVYKFLQQGRGVCQAYTLLYRALLDKCGIPSSYIASDSMDHIWNIVQLNGSWYHVDVTWDDPVSTYTANGVSYSDSLVADHIGTVSHNNFLRSDAGITSTKHAQWYPSYTTGTTYDSYFWITAESAPITWLDGKWYCINNDALCVCEPKNDLCTSKLTISDHWLVYNTPASSWTGVFSGLSVWGKTLVYNTPSAVYSVDPSASTWAPLLLYTVPQASSASYNHVYGSKVVGNLLKYTIANSPISRVTNDTNSALSTQTNYSTTLTPTVASLAVTTQPTGIFSVGESITLSSLCDKGLVLTVTYNNLTTEVLTAASAVGVSPSSLRATAGTQTITLTYGTESITIDLAVSGMNLITGVASDQEGATLPASLSALTVSNSGVVTVTPASGNATAIQVLVAAYDADGKMLEVKLVPITNEALGNAALTTTSTANKLSVFIVEPGASGKYAPVVAPLTWSKAA